MYLTTLTLALFGLHSPEYLGSPPIESLMRSVDQLPTGRLTVSLVTESFPVSEHHRQVSRQYANSANCEALIPNGGASRGEFAYLSRLPTHYESYSERAEWELSPLNFSGTTVFESFDPVVVANVNCSDGECRRWDVVEGNVSEMVRYSSSDPLESFTGGIYLMLREFKSLSTILKISGEWTPSVGGSWSLSLPLDKEAGQALVAPFEGRFLVPLNGVHELPGKVDLFAKQVGQEVFLAIEWRDCQDTLLTRTELRWSSPNSAFPFLVTEENFVPGTSELYSRRAVSSLWEEQTETQIESRLPSHGQLVIDRRFGTPVKYVMDSEKGVPSDRELIRQIELRSSRLAALGVERHKKPEFKFLSGPSSVEEDVEVASASIPEELLRFWWAWAPLSLLGVAVAAFGLQRVSADRRQQ